MVYVYELRNQTGKVEYVGVSKDPKTRMRYHTNHVPDGTSRKGLFYKRMDLTMNLISCFETRKEAYKLEAELKINNGLEPTEKNNGSRICKSFRKLNMNQAKEIRSLYSSGNYTHSDLGKMYSISRQVSFNIVTNKSYLES